MIDTDVKQLFYIWRSIIIFQYIKVLRLSLDVFVSFTFNLYFYSLISGKMLPAPIGNEVRNLQRLVQVFPCKFETDTCQKKMNSYFRTDIFFLINLEF